MGFWDLKALKLEEFRPGIWSKVEAGSNLAMAFMEIGPNKEGSAHSHPFDQCGVVVEGEIEMSIGERRDIIETDGDLFHSCRNQASLEDGYFIGKDFGCGRQTELSHTNVGFPPAGGAYK